MPSGIPKIYNIIKNVIHTKAVAPAYGRMCLNDPKKLTGLSSLYLSKNAR